MKKEVAHNSVMLNEVLYYLSQEDYSDKVFIDCTFGAGGHTTALLERGVKYIQ